ncbi:MAG: hypothetical protein KJP23_17235 [Deltaproteobacteria bacterium]|nr:hypothetical protein [Deltaproteobacteria bacterium]
MKHTRENKNEIARSMRMLPVILIVVITFTLGIAAPELWAFGRHHYWPEVGEFEDAECGFEVNVTDFDTGLFACVDAEGWKSLQIYRMGENYKDKQLLFSTWAAGNLRHLGITELCFESSEPEGTFKEILDMFPEGKCKFNGKTVDYNYLKSTDELTHDFACVPEEILFESNGDEIDVEEEECVPAGQDLVISWDAVVSRLVDLEFDEDGEVIFTCNNDDIEVDGYQVFVETGEDVEPSQELSFNPFDDESPPSVTIPGAFLKAATEYKFEVLVIEESGNKTIREIEFNTCP